MEKTWWSSWVCFTVVIMGKAYTRKMIREWFGKLVDKDDYAAEEKGQLLAYLYSLCRNKK